MSAAADALTRWQERWRHEAIDDALDDLSSALEELHELARGDKYPGNDGTLLMEAGREWERADKALNVLGRELRNLRAEQAS